MGDYKPVYLDHTILDHFDCPTFSGLQFTLQAQILQKDEFNTLLPLLSVCCYLPNPFFRTIYKFSSTKHVLLSACFRFPTVSLNFFLDGFLQFGPILQNSSWIFPAQ
jgi:hypothetical protein